MIKVGCGAISLLSLLAAGFLLWQAPAVAGALPDGLGAWLEAWIDLFHDPVSAVIIFLACAGLAVFAASVTELLLGLVFTVLAAATSLLCLIGVAGAHFPSFAAWLQKFFE